MAAVEQAAELAAVAAAGRLAWGGDARALRAGRGHEPVLVDIGESERPRDG